MGHLIFLGQTILISDEDACIQLNVLCAFCCIQSVYMEDVTLEISVMDVGSI